MFVRRFEGGFFAGNTYVAWCGETGAGVVIDPGGGARRALEHIAKAKIDVKYIVYTHAHPDHISGAGAVKKAARARIVGHRLATELLRGGMMRVASGFGFIFRPLPPEEFVDDGDKLEAGALSFEVLYTPGHTPDGISFAGGGAVFTGDLLMAGSVGRTDFAGGSHQALMASIREKILPLDGGTVIYPGHGPETTVGTERRANPWIGNIE
jgi:hydroxyacylglutathione hydrolase